MRRRPQGGERGERGPRAARLHRGVAERRGRSAPERSGCRAGDGQPSGCRFLARLSLDPAGACACWRCCATGVRHASPDRGAARADEGARSSAPGPEGGRHRASVPRRDGDARRTSGADPDRRPDRMDRADLAGSVRAVVRQAIQARRVATSVLPWRHGSGRARSGFERGAQERQVGPGRGADRGASVRAVESPGVALPLHVAHGRARGRAADGAGRHARTLRHPVQHAALAPARAGVRLERFRLPVPGGRQVDRARGRRGSRSDRRSGPPAGAQAAVVGGDVLVDVGPRRTVGGDLDSGRRADVPRTRGPAQRVHGLLATARGGAPRSDRRSGDVGEGESWARGRYQVGGLHARRGRAGAVELGRGESVPVVRSQPAGRSGPADAGDARPVGELPRRSAARWLVHARYRPRRICIHDCGGGVLAAVGPDGSLGRVSGGAEARGPGGGRRRWLAV